jgi:RimJ/RimL family protein N-acetyltransferase
MNVHYMLGQHVRLEALTSSRDTEVMKNWTMQSAAWRMLDVALARTPKLAETDNRTDYVCFLIYPLDDDRPIGHAGLFGVNSVAGETWLSIGLGERIHWEAGLATDALQVILRYAFAELGLSRVLIGVFDYDARAILSYEEAGFAIEGRMLQEGRQGSQPRAGLRMGVRRDAWEMTRNTQYGIRVS